MERSRPWYSPEILDSYNTNIWEQPFSPVRVILKAQPDPMELTLEDMGDGVKKP